MGQHNGRETVTIRKACELTDVSRRTMYNWMYMGKVEFVTTAGGTRMILVDTLYRDNNKTARAFTSVQKKELNAESK